DRCLHHTGLRGRNWRPAAWAHPDAGEAPAGQHRAAHAQCGGKSASSAASRYSADVAKPPQPPPPLNRLNPWSAAARRPPRRPAPARPVNAAAARAASVLRSNASLHRRREHTRTHDSASAALSIERDSPHPFECHPTVTSRTRHAPTAGPHTAPATGPTWADRERRPP